MNGTASFKNVYCYVTFASTLNKRSQEPLKTQSAASGFRAQPELPGQGTPPPAVSSPWPPRPCHHPTHSCSLVHSLALRTLCTFQTGPCPGHSSLHLPRAHITFLGHPPGGSEGSPMRSPCPLAQASVPRPLCRPKARTRGPCSCRRSSAQTQKHLPPRPLNLPQKTGAHVQ